jgi:hypothetical protein
LNRSMAKYWSSSWNDRACAPSSRAVEPDIEEGRRWLEAAVKAGSPYAMSLLSKLAG